MLRLTYTKKQIQESYLLEDSIYYDNVGITRGFYFRLAFDY